MPHIWWNFVSSSAERIEQAKVRLAGPTAYTTQVQRIESERISAAGIAERAWCRRRSQGWFGDALGDRDGGGSGT